MTKSTKGSIEERLTALEKTVAKRLKGDGKSSNHHSLPDLHLELRKVEKRLKELRQK